MRCRCCPARMTSMKLLHLDSGVLESHSVRLPHWIVPVGPPWQGRAIQTGTPSARSEQQDAGDRPADLLRMSLSGPQMSHCSLFAIDCSPLGSAEPPHQALRQTCHECFRGKLFKEDGSSGRHFLQLPGSALGMPLLPLPWRPRKA
jgi:hypothetical protein